MSKGTSPVHHFDGFYDPDYTAEISTKMQVPDRILLVEQEGTTARTTYPSQPEKLIMNVPDRILLGGDGKQLNALPESWLERENASQTPIHLAHPPNVISMSTHQYPAIDEPQQKKKYDNTGGILQPNGYVMDFQDYKSHPFSPSTPAGMTSFSNSDDELALLRRQVKTLTRRVLSIEQDNQQRQQREIVLYSAGITYFFIKGLFWLHRHW